MKKGGDSMEEIENLRKELGRLDDMIDMVESKIHNLIGLLELVYQGTKTVNGVEDSYEMCSISLMQSYLTTIEKTDMQEMHDMLAGLKGRV